MSAVAQLQQDTRFTAISLTDYMKLAVPETEYLVEGLVVGGSAVLFSAREKAGKGLIAIDMLISIATGTAFLGRAVKEGPVIYVALEENVGTLKNRLHARWPSGEDIPVYIVQMDGSFDSESEFYIDTPEGVDGLAELLQVIDPVAVVIDTLREAHRGRENESDDMAPRLKAIRALAHKTNTALIVTHHAAKVSGGARGSTAIRAAFDDFLEFTREDNDSDTEIRGVLHAEGRNLPKVVEHIAFDSSTFQWDVTAAPVRIETPNLRERILGVLAEHQSWLDTRALAEALPGVALGSVQNQLGRMVQEKPLPFAVDPVNPRKGHPRRFHTLQPEIPHHSSHMTSVRNEQKLDNVKPFPQRTSIEDSEAF